MSKFSNAECHFNMPALTARAFNSSIICYNTVVG